MKSAIVDLVSINRFVFEGTPIISQNSNDFCRELMGQASYPTQYLSIQRTDSTLIGCYDTKTEFVIMLKLPTLLCVSLVRRREKKDISSIHSCIFRGFGHERLKYYVCCVSSSVGSDEVATTCGTRAR